MANHSSVLAWKIPWTEESGRLQSRSCKELDTTEQLHFLSFFEKKGRWPSMLRRCPLRQRAVDLWVEL